MFGFNGINQNPFLPQEVELDEFPESQFTVDPVGDAVMVKKKSNWLDSLTEQMAGDRYAMTTEDDRKLARNQAIMALGDAFLKGSQQGDWGALAGVLGGGISDASRAFHGTMGDLSKRRVANRAFEDEQKLRALQLEDAGLNLNVKKEDAQVRKNMQVAIKQQLDEWEDMFQSTIGDEDITPEQRKEFTARLNGYKKMALADPSNPNNFAVMGTFMHDVMSAAGMTEQADKMVAHELRIAAAKAGMSVEEMLENNKIDDELKRKLVNAQIRAAEGNAAESFARRDAYKSGQIGGIHKQDVAQTAKRIDNTMRMNGGEMATYMTSWVAGDAMDSDTLARLKSVGVMSREQAADMLAVNSGLMSTEDYIERHRDKMEVPGVTWMDEGSNNPGTAKRRTREEVQEILRNNPDLRMKGNSLRTPKERAMFRDQLYRGLIG